MPSAVAGNLTLDGWTVLDLNDNPLTGMLVPGDVTLTLQRQSGSALVAASETVSWAEVGATGRYFFSFTPQNTGLYLLYLKEINVNTGLRQPEFRYDVLAAGAQFAPSYANAFCAESDLERWLGMSISATTHPSDTEAAGFAESRAAILMSLCAGLGYPVTPATVTAGSRLEDLLRDANSVGASADYLIAQGKGVRPFGAQTLVDNLLSLWKTYVGSYTSSGVFVPGLIAAEIRGNLASLATDYILSGDTQAAPTSGMPPTDIGISIGMGDVY
jgi:hypothetical protein